ncbi:MAG: hypothetical protein B7X35_06245 [Halothiobacillus sp. 14-56-357]|jgi:hypothetical protein|uniref:chalcone isomerase family protein n=1 Tax=Halothiobacillus sp. 15-55-196 TaxID=1970382 RepID=UPI000BD4C8A2|nr:chalcone isomerase family protein [Halothiobacillus sp. 15-55-196]OZB35257.1 MAG: hypothetical protein B7X44_10450 [Halothiobacillus sp. 15-55-196]OZB56308.1 MAG: hypothetical protein B7X35_06245 [Halothiobacillus sp. 14-56-357]OZB78810.1 MAG: hypothetical protein B7X29_03470 [Halothiobacillus sp. 13-55-115]
MSSRSIATLGRSRLIVAALLLFSLGAGTQAQASNRAMPKQMQLGQTNLTLLGKGTATYLWFDVYDAALYAPENTKTEQILSQETPKVLVLRYHHAVTVQDIEKASWQTLDKQLTPSERQSIKPQIDALQSSMRNVSPGDQYTLTWQPVNAQKKPELTLKLNDKIVFKSDNARLAATYFGIWLGKPPLSQSLKRSLLGG